MTPPPQANAVVRELGRLAFCLGLLEGGTPDWTALARACRGSSAALFAVMAQGGQVADETLFPLLDGILAVTSDRNPHYTPCPCSSSRGRPADS
jgi:hypothetical protein